MGRPFIAYHEDGLDDDGIDNTIATETIAAETIAAETIAAEMNEDEPPATVQQLEMAEVIVQYRWADLADYARTLALPHIPWVRIMRSLERTTSNQLRHSDRLRYLIRMLCERATDR